MATKTATIKLAVTGIPEEQLTVKARIVGPFGVHKSLINSRAWQVTHAATGYRVLDFPTRAEAIKAAEVIWGEYEAVFSLTGLAELEAAGTQAGLNPRVIRDLLAANDIHWY